MVDYNIGSALPRIAAVSRFATLVARLAHDVLMLRIAGDRGSRFVPGRSIRARVNVGEARRNDLSDEGFEPRARCYESSGSGARPPDPVSRLMLCGGSI